MVSLSSRLSPINVLLFVISISIGQFLARNPLLFGRKAPELPKAFKIYTSHPVLDRVLQEHQSEMGEDYVAYRNHCLRVMSFASHFLKENATESAMHIIAYALAYHDIGLWTDTELDYLEPSSRRMLQETTDRMHETDDMQDIESKILQSFNNDRDLATIQAIILQHHKYTPWRAPENSLADERLVNAVRKADWADASMGVVRFGLTAGHMEVAYSSLPEAGFHAALGKLTKKLSPDSILGRLKVLSIFKW
jgi:hypothetical protein